MNSELRQGGDTEQILKTAKSLSQAPSASRARLIDLRSEQVRQLYSQSIPGLVGAQISALVLPIALWEVVPPWRLLVWLAVYVIVQIMRNLLVKQFQKASPSGAEAIPWGTRFARITFISGLTWGMTGLFLFPGNSIPHQLLIALFLAGISAAALVAYSPLKSCYLPTISAEGIPIALRCFYELDFLHVIMGSVMLMYCVVLILTGNRVHKMNERSLRLGFEKNDLLESVLEKQQEAATLNEELRSEIQEKNRAQQAVIESEARYRELAELLPQLVFELDSDGNFTFVNRSGLDMIGRTSSDLLNGLAPSEVCSPDDWERAQREFGNVFSGTRMAGVEYSLKTVQNKDLPVIVYANPITREGKTIGVRGVGVDVSELKEAQKQLISSLEEKEVLMREIHHRVKNNLQVVCSLLRVQRRRLNDGQHAAALRESENRIVTMATAYEKLYQSPNVSALKASDYLRSLVRNVQGSYEAATNGIEVRTSLQDLTLPLDSAIPVGLIATELVSNCLKHAFPDSGRGRIEVLLHAMDDGRIELKVSDSGIGLPESINTEDFKSLGMRLVRIFVEQLRGELLIARNGGTTISVRFQGTDVKKSKKAQD